MPQRLRLPAWKWIVGAVLLAAVALFAYLALEQRLRVTQLELVSAEGQSVYSKSETAAVERGAEDLRLKLLHAETELKRLNEALNQARAELRKRDARIAMLSQGMASCDELFEEGDEVSVSAPSISVIFRIAREAAAAKDCLDKGDVATACKHWQGLLVKIEKIGAPVKESRVEIEDLMRQNHCQNHVSPAPARRLELQLNLGP